MPAPGQFLDCLKHQTNLKELIIEYSTIEQANFDWVVNCTNLEVVLLSCGIAESKNIDLFPFSKCPKLTTLTLGEAFWDYSLLNFFPALLNLTLISFPNNGLLQCPLPKEEYPGLIKLIINEEYGPLNNINFLQACPNLKELKMHETTTEDLSPIGLCSQLEVLMIDNCPNVKKL